MAAFSGTATGAARQLSHTLSLVTTAVLLVGTAAFVLADAKKRRAGPPAAKYGPFALTLAGAILIVADPVRHVLQDDGAWPPRPEGVPYTPSFKYSNQFVGGACSAEALRCLSLVGWTITVGATWAGFSLLLLGTLWNAKFLDKLAAVRAAWVALRRRPAELHHGHEYAPLPGGVDAGDTSSGDEDGETP